MSDIIPMDDFFGEFRNLCQIHDEKTITPDVIALNNEFKDDAPVNRDILIEPCLNTQLMYLIFDLFKTDRTFVQFCIQEKLLDCKPDRDGVRICPDLHRMEDWGYEYTIRRSNCQLNRSRIR